MSALSHDQGLVAVTGANGFVGSHVVSALRTAGFPVRALVRKTAAAARLRAQGCEVVLADIRDRRSLAEAFAGCRAVVHLVAVIRERGGVTFDAINRGGTADVVDASVVVSARLHGATVVTSDPADLLRIDPALNIEQP